MLAIAIPVKFTPDSFNCNHNPEKCLMFCKIARILISPLPFSHFSLPEVYLGNHLDLW
jgi:hypothetical protein